MGSEIQRSKGYENRVIRLIGGLFVLGFCSFLSGGSSEPQAIEVAVDQKTMFTENGLPDGFTKIADSLPKNYNEVLARGMVISLRWLPGFISPGSEDEKALYLCVAFADSKYPDYLTFYKNPGAEREACLQFYEVIDNKFYLHFEYLGDMHAMDSFVLTPGAKDAWIPGILLSFAAGPATANTDYFGIVIRDGKLQCIFQERAQDVHFESKEGDGVDEIVAVEEYRFENQSDLHDSNSKVVKIPNRTRRFKYIEGCFVVAE